MSEASDKLNHYLHSVGLGRPADIAQQVHISLLRQWIEHLSFLLKQEIPQDPDLRKRILDGMIYGGSPTLAEAEIRSELIQEMKHLLEGGASAPQTRKTSLNSNRNSNSNRANRT